MANTMLTDSTRLVTAGIDTHKDFHVAAVIDGLGTELATKAFPTNQTGYQHLSNWLNSHGTLTQVGIEGCSSWGAGIARKLTSLGFQIVEINRPNRQMRRNQGKSDPLDALAAARTALAGLDAGTPKTTTGPVEAIRMLRITRRSAVKTRTKTMNQIRALIDTAPEPVRDRYRHLTTTRLIKAICRSRPDLTRIAQPPVATTLALRTLGLRWQFLTSQISELNTHLDTLVATTAPNLTDLIGVGTDTAPPC